MPKFQITDHNKRKRRAWTKAHLDWQLSDWNQVIFSDEVTFAWNSGRINVWTRSKYPYNFPTPSKKTYQTKVMFWGCITAHGVGAIVPVKGSINAEKYQEVLRKYVLERYDCTKSYFNRIMPHPILPH